MSEFSIVLVCALEFLIIHSCLAQTSPQDFFDAHNEVRASEGWDVCTELRQSAKPRLSHETFGHTIW